MAQGAQTRKEKERTSFARLREPKELDRLESRNKPGAPTQTRARPEPGPSPPEASPAQPPLPPLLPSPVGAGREHKRLQLPSGHRPTPNSWPGPGRPTRGELRMPGGQGRARVAPGRRPGAAGLGGSTEGRRELLRLPGLPEPPKERVSKNRQRPARGGEERKGTRNSPPALVRSGPRPPLTRAEVWRKPRGTEGDGASALGGREGRGGPGRRVRSPSTRARVATASAPSAPLGSPRLRAPRRSRAPPH